MIVPRTFGLVLSMALALSAGGAQTQDPGVITGSALPETRPPYSDYLVRVRDAESGQLVGFGVVDVSAAFSADELPVSRPLLVELHNTKDGHIICVQGPYRLAADAPIRTDVVIECGKKPAVGWLMPASAGLATATAVGVHGISR